MISTDASPMDMAACSFCGKPGDERRRIIRGRNAVICTECIEHLHQVEILDRQQEQMLDATDDA
jgi:ATP-dependent protease Clp ATPase subunit